MFRECYALEKIHGTAAGFSFNQSTNELSFQSGGESHSRFVALFNQEQIVQSIKGLSIPVDQTIEIYGEAYGGSQQGMSHTYGKELKFIVFDVKIGDNFLSVPDAEDVAKKLGLEFVFYKKCSLVRCNVREDDANEVVTMLSEIDAERDAPSVQAVRNGVSTYVGHNVLTKENGDNVVYYAGNRILNPRPREGVVLRPLVEMKLNNGSRIIVKHKGDSFKETATPRPVVDPAKLVVLEEATAIANEWVTNTRLEHVLQKLPTPHDMSLVPQLIKAMTEDVLREGEGEIVVSDAAKKAIGKKAVELFKAHLNSQIK